MNWFDIEILDPSKLPQDVSGVFAAFIIFGIVSIFLIFIFKISKYYLENVKANKNQNTTPDPAIFDKLVEVYEKLNDISEKYAGRFATKEELSQLEEKLNETREDLSNVKGQMGIK